MHHVRAQLATAACLALLVVPGHGRSAECNRAADQTSLDICADQGLREADHRLNQTYQSLLKTISPQGAAKLRTAEHAWLTYRDAECEFETFSKDGAYSAMPMVRANCLRGLTDLHNKELAGQLHCVEGDIGCGLQ